MEPDLLSFLKKLAASKYFPTVSKPVVLGVLASGVTYGLRLVHVYTVPSEVQEAITPIVGLLTASILSSPNGGSPAPSGPSVGSQIASSLVDDLASVIDSNPNLVRGLALDALKVSGANEIVTSIKTVLDDVPAQGQLPGAPAPGAILSAPPTPGTPDVSAQPPSFTLPHVAQ